MNALSVAERTRTRRTLISLAKKRQRPGSGSTLEFLRRRTTNMNWPDLSGVLRDVSWAVVGAVATRLYMPERATQDLDIVVASSNSELARLSLQSAGFEYVGELSISGSSWRSPDNITIDVLEGEAEWWPDAIARAQQNRDVHDLPILSLPYLVLMKFQSGPITDIADITRMLGQVDEEALQKTRALFGRYEAEGLEDLQSLIELGRLETQD